VSTSWPNSEEKDRSSVYHQVVGSVYDDFISEEVIWKFEQLSIPHNSGDSLNAIELAHAITPLLVSFWHHEYDYTLHTLQTLATPSGLPDYLKGYLERVQKHASFFSATVRWYEYLGLKNNAIRAGDRILLHQTSSATIHRPVPTGEGFVKSINLLEDLKRQRYRSIGTASLLGPFFEGNLVDVLHKDKGCCTEPIHLV
jgi:hypothetical protein